MNIGFIGLGKMGGPMALNLIRAGHALTVHDLNPNAAQRHLDLGATWADWPHPKAAPSPANAWTGNRRKGVRSHCPRSVARASWSTTTPGTGPAETAPECPGGRSAFRSSAATSPVYVVGAPPAGSCGCSMETRARCAGKVSSPRARRRSRCERVGEKTRIGWKIHPINLAISPVMPS